MSQPPVDLVRLDEPRDLHAGERALLVRLLEISPVPSELREQARHVEVWSRCRCGCASIGLRVLKGAPRLDERGVWTLTGAAHAPPHSDVEVTLHVVNGEMDELEIWTGDYGVAVAPDADTLRFTDVWSRMDEE